MGADGDDVEDEGQGKEKEVVSLACASRCATAFDGGPDGGAAIGVFNPVECVGRKRVAARLGVAESTCSQTILSINMEHWK